MKKEVKKRKGPISHSLYLKVLEQYDSMVKENHKNLSILTATEREKDMISNLLVNTEKNLRATQEKLSVTNHEQFKMEVRLQRYERIIDVLIKDKE